MDDYLTQTTVLAGGKSIPMCDLTERRMEVMSNDEYDKLEQKQTQIYIGIPPSPPSNTNPNSKKIKTNQ